jgi:mRNA-degrading endonuclease toxin of MazEF toxin-antitoxin module
MLQHIIFQGDFHSVALNWAVSALFAGKHPAMVVQIPEYFPLGLIKYHSTPLHDTFGHLHGLIQVIEVKTLRTAPGEGRNEVTMEAAAVEIG